MECPVVSVRINVPQNLVGIYTSSIKDLGSFKKKSLMMNQSTVSAKKFVHFLM